MPAPKNIYNWDNPGKCVPGHTQRGYVRSFVVFLDFMDCNEIKRKGCQKRLYFAKGRECRKVSNTLKSGIASTNFGYFSLFSSIGILFGKSFALTVWIVCS